MKKFEPQVADFLRIAVLLEGCDMEKITLGLFCLLLIEMWHGGEIFKNHEYEEVIFFPKIQPIQKSNLTLTPTYLQPRRAIRIEDFRGEITRRVNIPRSNPYFLGTLKIEH